MGFCTWLRRCIRLTQRSMLQVEQNPWLGFGAIAVAVLCSGFAGTVLLPHAVHAKMTDISQHLTLKVLCSVPSVLVGSGHGIICMTCTSHWWVAQSCARGGSDQTLGSILLPQGQSGTGTGFPAGWLMPQACQCSTGTWTTPSLTCCNSWLAWSGQAAGFDGLCRSPPTELFNSVLLVNYLCWWEDKWGLYPLYL